MDDDPAVKAGVLTYSVHMAKVSRGMHHLPELITLCFSFNNCTR